MEGFLMLLLVIGLVALAVILVLLGRNLYTPSLSSYTPEEITKIPPRQFTWFEYDLRKLSDVQAAAFRPEQLEILAHRSCGYELQGRIPDEVMLQLSESAFQAFLPGIDDLSKLLAICKRLKQRAQKGSEAASRCIDLANEVLAGETEIAKRVLPRLKNEAEEKQTKADKLQAEIKAAISFLEGV